MCTTHLDRALLSAVSLARSLLSLSLLTFSLEVSSKKSSPSSVADHSMHYAAPTVRHTPCAGSCGFQLLFCSPAVRHGSESMHDADLRTPIRRSRSTPKACVDARRPTAAPRVDLLPRTSLRSVVGAPVSNILRTNEKRRLLVLSFA